MSLEGGGGEGRGGREGGREGGRGGDGWRGEMIVIHILMAPRYLYQSLHVLRNNVSQWHQSIYIYIYQTRHVLRNNALGVYVAQQWHVLRST